ncbi:hypothetical protein A2U01_0095972, partial [Trifolium medium]|nr:hypothetical protein [Trifolium medium]
VLSDGRTAMPDGRHVSVER